MRGTRGGKNRLRLIGGTTEAVDEVGEGWAVKCRRGPRKLLADIARLLLFWLRLTRLEPMEFDDQVTGAPLVICRSARYLMVTVGGRQYYFDPLTGQLDGTGSLLCRG